MKLQTAYLTHFNLTPNFENEFFGKEFKSIIKILRNNFINWQGIFDKYGSDFSIGFMITRKKGTEQLTVLGPTVSKKMKIVDYSIFLPDEIKDLNHYIDLVFEGIGIVLAKFNVSEDEVTNMKIECMTELNLL